MGVKARTPECGHVERKHYALGLCEPCWKRQHRRADPDWHRREMERRARRLQAEGVSIAGWHRSRILRRYGLTLAGFHALDDAQGGRCAICGGPPSGPGNRLHVDHCHATGTVRGLLCGNCNTAVGLMADDPGRLLSAVAYLKHAQKETA